MRVQVHWDGTALDPANHAELVCDAIEGDLRIRVDSPYYADPAPDAPPGSTPGLWSYEVVELFLLGADRHYLEIELAPGGHYWMLQLHGARQVERAGIPIEFVTQRTDDRWTGTARVAAEHLPPAPHAANAYAIHGTGRARQHYAAHPVPGREPDFHRLEHFRRWHPPPGLRVRRA